MYRQMPSWPTRLFLGSSSSSQSQKHPQTPREVASQVDRPGGATRPVTPLKSPPFATSSNYEASPASRRASHHGRSVSHPFPSIFGSGRKWNARQDEDRNVVDAKTLHVGSPGAQLPDQAGSSQLNSAQNEEAELISGRCATCDAHVRWPRHLDVFRCTVCLMINDQTLNAPKTLVDDVEVDVQGDTSEMRLNSGSTASGTFFSGNPPLQG